MDSLDRTFLDIIGLLKSWIPWRSEPANVSRDFWMPDQSCRVCYECDSQFTLFNRRHHCRRCGRVFCAKCTSNSVPAPPTQPCTLHQEEQEKVRVCNYCFKQWEQGLAASADNGHPVVNLESSTSISATSFMSFKSSGTCNSSSITVASMPYSAAELSPRQSTMVESTMDKKCFISASSSPHLAAADMGVCNHSSDGCEFCTPRSDDEEEEYGAYHLGSQRNQASEGNDYYNHIQFGGISGEFDSQKVHPDGEAVDTKSTSSSSVHNSMDSQTSEEVQQVMKKEGEPDIGYECETSSSLYVAENVSAEPVDFENNGLLWLPPEPEDEEDEREALLFDDDDDDGAAAGEWGTLRASSSFGSGEYKNKDKSNEEHKNTMKHVVDGHFRALVGQLMQVENLSMGLEDENDNWLDIIISLSWEAATLLKPDTSKGGGMDPGGYVKVKCIASGHCSDSVVVKGVVCKKNVAHRRMASKIEKPRILILGGALEYQRVSNLLSSVDTLLQQEMDHLKMAVAKIDAHQPDVLLVEKSVSRYAQEYLLAKDISLVLNIKRPLLERIARCTGGQIIPSIDHLSSQKLGYCDIFHVEKFAEEHDADGQSGKKMKTLMYFEGCPKPLGCTVLLRGANSDELKKAKHVVQYSVFAAYHLAMETSFLADEGASLPELPLGSPITVALPDKTSSFGRSISTIPGFTFPFGENTQGLLPSINPQRSFSVPAVDLVETANRCSQEEETTDFATLYTTNNTNCILPSVASSQLGISNYSSDKSSLYHAPEGRIITSFMQEPSVGNIISEDIRDHLVSCGSTPVAMEQVLQQEGKHAHEDSGSSKEGFLPSSSDHQSILVSLSSRCVWKGTVCERSHLFRIKYYGNFDKPLGRFLRDHLFDQSYRCRSCELPSEAHVQCYTHHQGTLTISVKRLPEFILSGEREGKIWMWHRCLKCPRFNGFPPATRRVVMSDAAWGLSFGKFLELSFSNHAAASRVASCGHSLHRDCLRFYGFGKMVACFRYASIDVHSVYLPPSKLDFNCENQDWIQEEVNEVVGWAELMFSEILNALGNLAPQKCALINNSFKASETKHQMTDLETMLHKGKAEFEESLQKISNKEVKKGQPAVDIFEINRLKRQLIIQSYVWDRLLSAASSDSESQCVDEAVCTSDVDKSSNGVCASDHIPVSAKLDDSGEGVTGSHINEGHLGGDVGFDSNNLMGNPNSLSFVTKASESDPPVLRRVLSDGQSPIMGNLSDTLDAAWTGESNLAITDSSANGLVEKVDVEDSGEELGVPKLSASFINFYRSLNKNFLGSAQKLDTIGEYNPVYIPSFLGSDGARLLLPVGVNGTVIPVYDDEPTSLISYALASRDYSIQLSNELDRPKESADQSLDDILSADESTKIMHARVSFADDGPQGKAKYTVTCYYAKRFEALRRVCCPSETDYIRSLSRCKKWGAQGGKSNVFFAKTLDDRFIIKQVTKTELESFIKFAPEYFKYLSESISTGSPTCLAKILGIYQVTSKHLKGGKESKMDVLVMENLLFGRKITRLYDLKGSSRSRYNPDCSGSNKVLLDQNLIESMPTCPIFVGNKAKRLLERAVWNDTAFLASVDVMDYSLLVGVDEEKHELVLGIIDFMRQYTWDKHLETWVKASGILGGPKNASPTVISPKQYKKRFRKAMTTYFLMIPDQWSSTSTAVPSKLLTEENTP